MKTRIWLGVAVSVSIVAFVAYRVDLGQLFSSLRNARLSLILLAALTLLTTLLIRAWRWQYLMEAIKPIGIADLLSATTIGAMADMIVPGRGGDVVRAYVVGRKENVGKMASLGTIVVERVLDVFTILLIAVPMAALIDLPDEQSTLVSGFKISVYVAIIVCVSLLAAGVVLVTRYRRKGQRASVRSKWLSDRLSGRISDLLDDFASGLQTIKKGRHLFAVLVLSIVLWSTFALSNFFVFRSFSLDLPYYAPFFFLVFQVLGVTLPSSPGFIGTYHAGVLAAFTIFEVSQEMALSVAITMHAAFFFPFIVVGLFFLWRENLSLAMLKSIDTTRA